MKGFPNQIADVVKLARAYSILADQIHMGLPDDDDLTVRLFFERELSVSGAKEVSTNSLGRRD